MNPFLYRLQTELAFLSRETASAMALVPMAAEHPAITELRNKFKPAPRMVAGGLAVVPIHGLLARKPSPFEMAFYGVEDSGGVVDVLNTIAADAAVAGVLLDIDSPGGMVVGGLEIAAAVAALESRKPVVAWSGGRAASLGYHLAAPSTLLIGSQSSEWGSIGCVVSRLDITEALKAQGLRQVTYTSAGADLKALPGEGPDMTDKHKAYIQARVDALGADFQAHVRTHRGNYSTEVNRGGMFYAKEAMAAGLIDSIGTMGFALGMLAKEVAARR